MPVDGLRKSGRKWIDTETVVATGATEVVAAACVRACQQHKDMNKKSMVPITRVRVANAVRALNNRKGRVYVRVHGTYPICSGDKGGHKKRVMIKCTVSETAD
jgi:hypothetical protein